MSDIENPFGGPSDGDLAHGLDADAPPMRPASTQASSVDPYDGEADAPALAGAELGGLELERSELGGGEPLGGGEAPDEVAPTDTSADLLDRAADALLELAADRPWRDITLREVAARAGVGFAELYARAPGKAALLWRLSQRMDRAALAQAAADDQPSARDRLFEAFMARLEAMEPHRAALIAIGRAVGPTVVAPRLPATVRGLLEASGVDTSGARGALRVAAFTAAWARTLQVWRDDEGALNRTMAEIDKLLARTDKRLSRVGAGL